MAARRGGNAKSHIQRFSKKRSVLMELRVTSEWMPTITNNIKAYIGEKPGGKGPTCKM
jgi:hypothetical protein